MELLSLDPTKYLIASTLKGFVSNTTRTSRTKARSFKIRFGIAKNS